MTSADDPRPSEQNGIEDGIQDGIEDLGSVAAEAQGYTRLTQAQALDAPGIRGALFSQWARQKRRRALEQRYGEDAPFGDDDEDFLNP